VNNGPTQGEGPSTWERLRRRKVVQWGLAYAACAWGFLQGLQYVSDAFGWPPQLRQAAIFVLLIGLSITVVVAWYHGDRGEQRVTRVEFSILTLLFLLGGGIFWRYQHATEPASTAAATDSSTTAISATSAADAGPSIAVLLFDNRSAKADDAYFVDGIHDDILTQLSRISALKVISRTSVEQFRDTKLSIREIAARLGVRSILEGGVQRAGDRVRISVQLIDASSDAHLWAESYDRELNASNLFAIQTEVAAAIADELRAVLTPAEQAKADVIPTQSLEAWENYHLGQRWLAKRSSAAVSASIAHFEKAIVADPKFALAYAGLASALMIQGVYEFAPRSIAFARAEEVVGRALALDPDLAEARTALGGLYSARNKPDRAAVELRKAIELNPNYATAYQWYAEELMTLGRLDEALQAAEKALSLDPLSVIINNMLGVLLESQGRIDEALAAYRRALTLDPALPVAYTFIAVLYGVTEGRFDKGIPYLEKAAELDPSDVRANSYRGYQYLNLGDYARAEHFLSRALQLSPEGVQSIDWMATLQLYRGQPAKAQDYARRSFAIDPREGWSIKLLRNAEVAVGDWPAARALYAQAFPELLDAASPNISSRNLRAAVDLALVLQRTGESERAGLLLDRSEQFIGTVPRLPWSGYWIADVEIHALRGRKVDALKALRAAETSRWRTFWRYYRDFEPNLDSIRNEPEFKAVFADIERDMASQRAELAARPKDAPLPLG
jgi:TolB-like protein/Tfp pilus assembly protein PilF